MTAASRPRRLAAAAALLAWLTGTAPAPALADPPPPEPGALRVATFNASLSRTGAGLAWQAIAEGRDQPAIVAEIIQRVRPDVLLLQEIDHDPEHRALEAFARLLEQGRNGAEGIAYPHRFAAPVNTGEPSDFDLTGDGMTTGPGDAHGWGRFPGQYGMAVLSRLPIEGVRSFRLLRWAEMPGHLMPPDHYPPEAEPHLRLSSKSHWDVTLRLPDGRGLHLLASHPTPPVFDGPEDRNGRRNHDEIRFWIDYIDGAAWIRDDDGRAGGLPEGAGFAVAGDLNSDPFDGDSRREALLALLAHPRVQDAAPRSPGAVAAAEADGGANRRHRGDPGLDTARWRPTPGPGNLRVDYVLPSTEWRITGSGVFWPAPDDPLARLTAGSDRPTGSDHRLVWVDLR